MIYSTVISQVIEKGCNGMSNQDKKKQNKFTAFLDNHRSDIDFFLGGALDTMNATIFTHLTAANLAKFLFEGVLKMIAFPIVLFLATVDWVWSITKAVRDWKKGERGITATVVHAIVMSIAYPLIATAITLSFMFTTLFTPIFFVAAFSLLTFEAWGSAIYHTYKALKAEKGSPERKQHATQAKFLFTFAVVASVLTAMIGVVMIKIAPAISATYAAIGIGASVTSFIGRAALWRHLRKQQKQEQVDKPEEAQALLKNVDDPLAGRQPAEEAIAKLDYNNRTTSGAIDIDTPQPIIRFSSSLNMWQFPSPPDETLQQSVTSTASAGGR